MTLVKQLEAAIADLLKLRVAELPEFSEFDHKTALHGLLVTGGPRAKRTVLRVAELPEFSEFDDKTALHGLLVTDGPSAKRTVKPSLERTLRDLHTIEEQTSALRATFETLGDPAASVFANRGGIRRMLWTLEIVARDGAKHLATVGDIEPRHAPKRKIDPPNSAQLLALECAFVFLMVTGKEPTRVNSPGEKVHGPFIDFLRAVFKARGVSSSLETSARYAVKGMRRTGGDNASAYGI